MPVKALKHEQYEEKTSGVGGFIKRKLKRKEHNRSEESISLETIEKQAKRQAETLQLDGFLRNEMPDFAMSATELERAIKSLQSSIAELSSKVGHSNTILGPLKHTLIAAQGRLADVKYEEEVKEIAKAKQVVYDIARAANANKDKEKEKDPKQVKSGTMANMLADLSELLRSNNITYGHLRMFLQQNNHQLVVLGQRNGSFAALHTKLGELVASQNKVGSGDRNKLSKQQIDDVRAFVESLNNIAKERTVDRGQGNVVGYFTSLVMRQRQERTAGREGGSFSQSVRG